MAGPWEKYSGQAAHPQPQQDPVIARDPYKVEDQQIQRDAAARAARDQELQERRFQITQEREQARDVRAAAKDQEGSSDERTAGFLTGRIKDAVGRLAGAGMQDRSALSPSMGTEIVRKVAGNSAANYMTDPDRQVVRAAQLDILDAALTLGTGAAYNQEQLESYRESYFPQLGDDPKAVASKNEALRSLLVNARVKAGKASPDIDAALASLEALNKPEADQDPDGLSYANPGVGGAGTVTDETPPPGGPPETRDPSGLSGLGALAKQGLSLGLSDEAAGIGGYLSGFLTGEDPSKAYARERDTERQFIGKARSEWGAMGIGAELLGGGGAARIASAPNSLGQFARQGAGIGAVGGYGYGEGDASVPNALLGATGGAALGYGLGRAGNALANRAARNAPDMAVVQAGERQGVPIRQPDARPELRGQYAATESTQAGGPVVRAAKAADDAAIEGRISEVGGAGTASDPYALGSRVQQAGQRYIARTKQQANRLYDRARQTSQGQAVEAKDALAAVDANIAELRAAGENSNRGQIAYLEGLREDLSKPLTIEAVQNLRSNMRGQLSERNLTGTDAERRVRQVIDAANADLTRELPQEASTALRAADDFYRQRQEFITGTLQQFMGSRGNPLPAETAAKRLVSMAQGKGNFERFSNMWRELEPAEQADAAATIAASLGRRQNGDFSPAILIKSLDPRNGLNPRTARLVFGDEGAQALNDLRAIAQAKNEAMNRQSPSGQAISAASGGLKTLLMGAFGFGAGGPGGAAAGAVGREFFARWGEQRAARMLLNPDFTKWLRNAPNTANPQAIDRYFSRLAGIGSIAANDNQAFTNALMSAFRKSPGAAAAGESGDSRREPPSR